MEEIDFTYYFYVSQIISFEIFILLLLLLNKSVWRAHSIPSSKMYDIHRLHYIANAKV